jgi:hypothetical protein
MITDAEILNAAGIEIVRTADGFATPAPLVHICAWCDADKVQTRALRAQGKRVSHTCCPEHTRQMLDRARELNARSGA